MGEKRNAYALLEVNPGGKRPLGRSRHRWVHIKINIGDTGWDGMDWTGLAQDRDKWRAI
jgi:hypothetical protein